MYTVTIPVKPYVSKFILSRYQQPIWEINKQDRIGKFVYSLLERMPARYEKSKLNLGDTLTIQICRDYARNKGIYISNESTIEFNDFIQLELIEEIAMYVYRVKNRIGLKKYNELYIKLKTSKRSRVHVIQDPDVFQFLEKREVIYDILKHYDITEDDFPFETVYKACQRLKLPLLSA